jgi:hypothetical protein
MKYFLSILIILIDSILRDLIGSGILSASANSLPLMSKYMSALRDKYDMNSLWYELDVESIITAAVGTIVNQIAPTDLLATLPIVRELIVDDDGFDIIVEFSFLPNLNMSVESYLALQAVVSPAYYETIYTRFIIKDIEALFVVDLEEDNGEEEKLSLLISAGWMSLVPASLLVGFLATYISPRLQDISDPKILSSWKPFYTIPAWSELVLHFAGRILSSLRVIDPAHHDSLALIRVAIGWQTVIPPLLIGFLLFESGFMSRWFEHWLTHNRSASTDCRAWLLTLAPVTYHSPAKKFVTDLIQVMTGTDGGPLNSRTRPPSGPPRGYFSNSAAAKLPMVGLSEAAIGKLTFGDVIREECEMRNIPLVPKMGVREAGCQVYRLGEHVVYWRDDALFERKSNEWIEISLDSVLR